MLTNEITRTKVEILGHQYTLKGDLDPEYMASLARYVDEKLNGLKKIMGRADTTRLALLVALNLADELFQSERKLKEIPDGMDPDFIRKIEEKTEKMISLLEEGLVGEPLNP